MPTEIQIHVYGSLRKWIPELRSTWLSYRLEHSMMVSEVIDALPLPDSEIQMVMVNHRAVTSDTIVQPGDRMALFPREYPLFVDWKDFRRN